MSITVHSGFASRSHGIRFSENVRLLVILRFIIYEIQYHTMHVFMEKSFRIIPGVPRIGDPDSVLRILTAFAPLRRRRPKFSLTLC